MDNTRLDTIRRMLQITSTAQMLFDGECLVAMSSSAAKLFPTAREGAAAAQIFGEAVEQYRQFSGSGSLLFTVSLEDFMCDVTVASCEEYRLVTAVLPWESLGMNTMLSISEGVRQPMANIMAITPKILPKLEQLRDWDPKIMDRASELNRNLYSIMRITSNLQMYGAFRGNLSLRMSRYDISAWLDDLAARVRPLCESAGQTLECVYAKGDYLCAMDGDRMERAVLNLLSNAMKFSERGTVITLSLRRAGNQILLTVRDQGCGIPADQMGVVFNRSEHRGVLPDPRWGVGLGLPIARSIVQAHGGRLMLESEEGVGTSVHISLNPRINRDICILRSPVRLPDYSGGFDHVLMELADALPASVFDTRGVDL